MVVDVSDAFKDLEEEIIVERSGVGSYINGCWQEPPPIEETILGVVQNATPEDLLALEEGQRTEEAIKIHTTSELFSASERTQKTGDVILYNGEEWRVHSVAKRYIGNYFKAIAIRQRTYK